MGCRPGESQLSLSDSSPVKSRLRASQQDSSSLEGLRLGLQAAAGKLEGSLRASLLRPAVLVAPAGLEPGPNWLSVDPGEDPGAPAERTELGAMAHGGRGALDVGGAETMEGGHGTRDAAEESAGLLAEHGAKTW